MRKDDMEIEVLKDQVAKIGATVDKIKDNHLVHIGDDIVGLQRSVSVISTNQEWLMKYHWITASASIGAVLTGFYSIFHG